MRSPLLLLRSWLREERRLLPDLRRQSRGLLLLVALLLLLLGLELRRREAVISRQLLNKQLEALESVSASLAGIRRTGLDWARWNDSYAFVQGRNPRFVSHDLANTSLFEGGGVMVIFDAAGKPLLSYGSNGLNHPLDRELIHCSRDNLQMLRTLSSVAWLACRQRNGALYLGTLLQMSNNDSSAPAQGSLAMFEPLLRLELGPRQKSELRKLESQLVRQPRGSSADAGTLTIDLDGPLLAEDNRQLALQRQNSLPLVLASALEDLGVLLMVLTPFALARALLMLERRRQTLHSLLAERAGKRRIRRACNRLDDLLNRMGLDQNETESGPRERVLARLLGSGSSALPAPEPRDPEQLEGRLGEIAGRFQRFLEGAGSLALLDQLTSLPNRRYFLEQLELETQRHRETGTVLAMLYVDVDKFKDINDTFGHDMGDQVLVHVSRRLRSLIGAHDFVARYGGDEFVILRDLTTLSETDPAAQREEIRRFAARVASAFEGILEIGSTRLELSLSIGIALIEPDLIDPARAIRHCDLALLEAKRNKHNRIAIFELGNHNTVENDYELFTDLLQAIRDRQLTTLFQPICDGRGRIIAVEALARWRHPRLGPVPPDVFVSLAERYRQMQALGDELLRIAISGFMTIAGSDSSDLRLSLNLSPSQLENPALVNRLDSLLEAHQLSAKRLTIELTEQGIVAATPVVNDNLRRLREAGIHLSLDDFGTGFSSLSLLGKLRPDEVKIDRSFVMAMPHDPYARQIVALVSRMAPDLGVELVAEGVDDPVVLQQLSELGIERFQGYLLAMPLPAAAIDIHQTLAAATATTVSGSGRRAAEGARPPASLFSPGSS